MNLYHWRSKVIEAYGPGHIIVMAETVEDARVKAFAQYQPLNEDHPTEEPYLVLLSITEDEDFHEEYRKKLEILKEDLTQDPEIITEQVVFIRGSD